MNIINEDKKITIDELAIMINKGFENTTKQIRKEIKEEVGGLKEEVGGLKEEFGGLKKEVTGMKDKVEIMSKEIDSLQRGQVRIEDRLDNIVSDKKVLDSHEKRISILEKKAILAN
jgi:predicted  nucleic acid-binding Zn-ribbon protein